MRRLEIFENLRSYVRHRRRQAVMDDLTKWMDINNWHSWLIRTTNRGWLRGIAEEAVHFWLIHKNTTQVWLTPSGRNMMYSDGVIPFKLKDGLYIVYTPEMLQKGVDYIMNEFIHADWLISPDEENPFEYPFKYVFACFGEYILAVPERLRHKVQHIHVICIYDSATESTAVQVVELIENAINPTKEEATIYEFYKD